MPKRISINVGFITNSSSCIYYFPKEVLEDQEVKDFISKYGMEEGFVGEIWYRSSCDSFLVTSDQKLEAQMELEDSEYCRVTGVIDPNNDGAYVLFGDEYQNTVHILNQVLSRALDRLRAANPNLPGGYVTDYN